MARGKSDLRLLFVRYPYKPIRNVTVIGRAVQSCKSEGINFQPRMDTDRHGFLNGENGEGEILSAEHAEHLERE